MYQTPKKVGLTDIFLARGRFGVLYEPDNKLDFQKKIIHMLNNYRSYTKKANLAYKSLDRFNFLFAAAGHPNCVFEISFEDLQKITNGNICEITE